MFIIIIGIRYFPLACGGIPPALERKARIAVAADGPGNWCCIKKLAAFFYTPELVILSYE